MTVQIGSGRWLRVHVVGVLRRGLTGGRRTRAKAAPAHPWTPSAALLHSHRSQCSVTGNNGGDTSSPPPPPGLRFQLIEASICISLPVLETMESRRGKHPLRLEFSMHLIPTSRPRNLAVLHYLHNHPQWRQSIYVLCFTVSRLLF
jgi:hypothetical protein